MNSSRPLRLSLGLAALALLATRPPAAAQQPGGRVITVGVTPTDTGRVSCLTDSLLDAAVAAYNSTAAFRVAGDFTVPAGGAQTGTLAVFQGRVRIAGAVHGDVVLINGDLRILGSGRVDGNVLVLGGFLAVDSSAAIRGARIACQESAPIGRELNGSLSRRRPGRSLGDLTTAATTLVTGPVSSSLHVGFGVFNRIEGLPFRIGPTSTWTIDPITRLTADLTAIIRTSGDPTGTRSALGWSARVAATRKGEWPLTLGLEAGNEIVPTASAVLTDLESSLAAIGLRRDRRDWYQRKGWGAFASMPMSPRLAVALGYHEARETTQHEVDAFSIFRSDEPWRPNPLIDDGRYRNVSLEATFDSRDDRRRPRDGTFVHAELRHILSNDLAPISLPEAMRPAMPTSGYGTTTLLLDARRWLRISLDQTVAVRLFARGYLGGDPLTIQQRLAVGGEDPLPAYRYHAFNCDRRLRADPSLAGYCDRAMGLQAEYRHALPFDLTTRIGRYTLGPRRAEIVVFGDLASAWLTGDSTGQVPRNRILKLSQWRSDIGIGLDAGSVGVYLAKAISDADPARIVFRLSRRF